MCRRSFSTDLARRRAYGTGSLITGLSGLSARYAPACVFHVPPAATSMDCPRRCTDPCGRLLSISSARRSSSSSSSLSLIHFGDHFCDHSLVCSLPRVIRSHEVAQQGTDSAACAYPRSTFQTAASGSVHVAPSLLGQMYGDSAMTTSVTANPRLPTQPPS